MTDDDAKYYAETMKPLEREIIALCALKKSLGYHRLAEQSGASYDEVKSVGAALRAMNLAKVVPVRMGHEFNGSAIFLNARGEQVRLAIRSTNQN